MVTPDPKEIKPIIAREDQEGRYIGDVCHVEGCPCLECAAAERADRQRWAKARGEELEPAFDPQEYADRVIAAWATMDFSQRDLSIAFVNRYDGQWVDRREYGADRQEYRFDSRRGRWMEFKDGHWTPADTILDAVGGLIERLCGDKPSVSAKWGKLAVYRDILTLAREHLTIDEWDADGGLMGLPNGDMWDLERGYSMPNFQRLPITKQTGADPDELQNPSICGFGCICLWHRFLGDVTGKDPQMEKHLQLSIGSSLFGGNRDHRLNVVCGDGGTGKSVFLNAIAAALGDYAGSLARVCAGE